MESLPSLVRRFNSLPRSKATPTGLANHWVFGIRHVPLPPEGDIVFTIHPASRYTASSKDPAQIVSLPTAGEKAQAMLPLLLNAFITMNEVPPHIEDPGHRGFETAPWSWSCDDADIAAALQSLLVQAGVPEGLRRVGVATTQEQNLLGEEWSRMVGKMMKMMGMDVKSKREIQAELRQSAQSSSGASNVCATCRKPASEGKTLKVCAKCRGDVRYCSRECQQKDWKAHKKVCGRTAAASSSAVVS
jgi:hypothetical protein